MPQQSLQLNSGVALACLIRRACMAQGMTTELLRDPCLLAVLLNNIHHPANREACSLVIQEETGIAGTRAVCKVGFDGLGRFFLQIHRSLFVALAVYQHTAVSKINMG